MPQSAYSSRRGPAQWFAEFRAASSHGHFRNCSTTASRTISSNCSRNAQQRNDHGGRNMNSKPMFVALLFFFASAMAVAQVREVTVTEIPGVVAAGAKWTVAWQGTDNADGIVGTADGGLLFAQEQPNHVSKLDKNDHVSVFIK